MKGVKTTDFEIDPYLSLAEPLVVIKEASKKYGIDIITTSDLVQNPTVQKLDIEDMVNIEFKEYFQKNKAHIEELPGEVQIKLLQKAKIRPYQRSVLKFRDIMQKPCSPLLKLFMIQTDLTLQINADINEFWSDLLTDYSKITLNRDELTSIMLFIIARAEVPDLMS